MRIGIDCRKAADYGIGAYIRGLLGGMARLQLEDEFYLFAPERLASLLPAGPGFTRVVESSPHYSVRELFSLGREITRRRLDLFHATHYVVPFTAVPVVVTIHDLIHLKLPVWRRHPLAPLYARWMLGRAARRSVGILTGTEAVRRDLDRYFPGTAGKVVVTRFGVAETFTPGPADPQRLDHYGLRAGRYFLFVGNDKPHKNLERLVEAFRLIRQQREDLELALVGGTRRFPGAGIVQAGFVEESDLLHIYRGAVALIQPSIEEGFGMPVVEAMSCGTPSVISGHPALREVAGETALVADCSSGESLAEAMRQIAGDDSLRARLGAISRARAKSFSWRSCAEQTLAVYRQALSS